VGPSQGRAWEGDKEEAEEEEEPLDSEDKLAYKRRIVALLEPGETVLAALRRLGDMASRQRRPGRDMGRQGFRV
jgi:hypothetical protein